MTLRLADDCFTTHVLHGLTVSSIFSLIDMSSWSVSDLFWRLICRLHLLLKFLVSVLELSPFVQNLHCLNVLNGCQFFSVVLVTTECVKINLFTKTFILVLDNLQERIDLLTAQYFLVIHTSDGVEDGPHDLRVVHSAKMVTNV